VNDFESLGLYSRVTRNLRQRLSWGELFQLRAAIIAIAKIKIGNEEYLEKLEIFLPILDEGLQLLCGRKNM
jgi:hypothetical protein